MLFFLIVLNLHFLILLFFKVNFHASRCLANLKMCSFSGCEAQLTLSDLKSHELSCSYRPFVSCSDCGITLPDNAEEHIEICSSRIVSCRLLCGLEVTRRVYIFRFCMIFSPLCIYIILHYFELCALFLERFGS